MVRLGTPQAIAGTAVYLRFTRADDTNSHEFIITSEAVHPLDRAPVAFTMLWRQSNTNHKQRAAWSMQAGEGMVHPYDATSKRIDLSAASPAEASARAAVNLRTIATYTNNLRAGRWALSGKPRAAFMTQQDVLDITNRQPPRELITRMERVVSEPSLAFDFSPTEQVQDTHFQERVRDALMLPSMSDVAQLKALGPEVPSTLFTIAMSGIHAPAETALKYYMTASSYPGRKPPPVVEEVPAKEQTFPRPSGDVYYARPWGEHVDVEVVRRARELDHFILAFGLPGTGKTALIEAAFGPDMEWVLGTGDTEVSDFIGGYVPGPDNTFLWVDGPLLRAAERGVPLGIDEVGLVDPKVMSVVYSFMDGRREYVVTANPERGTVKAKKGFYVVAATNPNAPGVMLSEALLSRFPIHVEMTTDYVLAESKLGVPHDAVHAATNLERKYAKNEVGWFPQMRELLAFRDLSRAFGENFALANMIASAPEQDRGKVAKVLTTIFAREISGATI